VKGILITSLGVIFVISFTNLGWGEDYDFRKTKWGLSKQEVKASENLKPVDDPEHSLTYKTRVLEKDVFLVYIFVEDKLVRTKYILADKHMNKNDYIQDYNDFKKVLTKKYGRCKEDEVIWKKDVFDDKDHPERWGGAIATGNLIFYSAWETHRTKIGCGLYGDNFDITCAVEYVSKDLKPLEEKQKEKKAMEDL